MNEQRIYGTVDDIADEAAEVSERGFLLMFRDLFPVDGDEAFECVAAGFGGVNGNPLARMRIGEEVYLFRIDDLETAFSDPAPSDEGSKPGIETRSRATREECLQFQGGMQVAREVREMEGGELLYEPLAGRFLRRENRSYELRLGKERFLFDPDDFWTVLTDPATFRTKDHGPTPIDALRDPIDL